MLWYHTVQTEFNARGTVVQNCSQEIVQRTELFAWQVEQLRFSGDFYIYNPLQYAWNMHEAYIRKYLAHPVNTLMLGMNPGPFGMAQNGIPFGEVGAVREFLKLDEPIKKPAIEHPSRPVLGLSVQRSEVSGKRLWALMAEHYENADAFSQEIAITNYCPLAFMEQTKHAKNITPDKLPKGERMALEAICDRYLLDLILLLKPTYLIGVGTYALKKLQQVVSGDDRYILGSIIHPSPANPQANRNWQEKTQQQLVALGVWKNA
jgi:single-strand selective monofunctional uracil DNA glycosylase